MAASARRPTPGPNGHRRNYCRIRRCTRSPNGAASGSARTCPPNSAWPTSRTLWAGRPRPDRICASARAAGRCPLARGSGGEARARGVAPPATGGDGGMDFGGRADATIVLAFEDLHWADPTSLDLMRALAERGAQAPSDHCDGAAGVPPALEREVAP